MLVFIVLAAIQVTLLLTVLLGIAAHRQRDRTDATVSGWGVPITDEVDVVAARAATATAAAERALSEAEQAQFRAVEAAAVRDMAEQRHRLAVRRAETAGEAYQLVQRAALDAYQRGQLSVDELNRIWRHTQAMADPGDGPAAVPLGWELRVQEARRRYDQAVAVAARAQEEARLKAVAAAAATAEEQAADSLLSTARRSADTGLVGLLRASW